MGIQNFYSIFDVLSVNSIPIFRSGEQKKVVSVDHLLVDLNNCLYLFTSPGRENFVIQNVCHFIDRLLSIFQPKKAVFLALDGPGPKAKYFTQRTRREQALEHATLTAKFTSGTSFMDRLKQALCLFVTDFLATQSQYQQVKFYVSGADREGEGEYKIFEYIRHCEAIHNSFHIHHKFSQDDTFLIVGNDSDLVILSLLETHKKIFFLRTMNINTMLLYNINDIRNAILQNVPGAPEKIIEDFVLLALLNGSDYLPKLMGFNFLKSWRYYKYLKTQPRYEKSHFVIHKSKDAFVYDLSFLCSILNFCQSPQSELKLFVFHENERSLRNLNVPTDNPISSVNILLSSFYGQKPLFKDIDQGLSHSTRHRYYCELFMVHPDKCIKGENLQNISLENFQISDLILLGTGSGSRIKDAHYQACIKALRPPSPLFDFISQKINQQDLQELINYYREKNWTLYEETNNFKHLADSSSSKYPSTIVSVIERERIFHYFQMLSWILLYWSPLSPPGTPYYHYLQSPSIQQVTILAKENSLLYVDLKSLCGEEASTDDSSHPTPLYGDELAPPLAFCLAVSAPSMALKLIPQVLVPLARQFGPVLDFKVDTNTTTISFVDRTKQFSKIALDYLCNLSSTVTNSATKRRDIDSILFAQQQLTFQPTLLFFKDNPQSPLVTNFEFDSKTVLKLTAVTLNYSFRRYDIQKIISDHRVICLAEEPNTKQNTIRHFKSQVKLLFDSQETPHQQQRHYCTIRNIPKTVVDVVVPSIMTSTRISSMFWLQQRCSSFSTLFRRNRRLSSLKSSSFPTRPYYSHGNSFRNLVRFFVIR